MSMLAEPRRKQRWSLNPRGKQWSDDSNKFGQKMLEKMGWSSGKGLGAKEQGATEHIRVKVKNDTLGIGFNENHMDKAWTEHQEGFNEILQQLQRSQASEVVNVPEKSGELSGKSLELKSKQSKARVHYQKFTRGKDVNKYSTKDLANIFGQKDLNGKTISKETENDDKVSVNTVGSETYESGVITIHRGSMTDYFKNKASNYIGNTNKENIEKINNSEDESVQYRGFGFSETKVVGNKFSLSSEAEYTKTNCAFDNPCLSLNDSVNNSVHNEDEEQQKTPKPSKKRKKEFGYENVGLDLNSPERQQNSKKLKRDVQGNSNEGAFVNDALDLESQTDESHIGREFEVSRPEVNLANKSINSLDGKNKDYLSSEHSVSNTDSAKKKKKKAKTTDSGDGGFINTALDLESQPDESHNGKEFEVPRPQSSLPNILNLPTENNDNIKIALNNQVTSNTSVKKKKKKVTATNVCENQNFDGSHNGKAFELTEFHIGIANKALDITDESSKKRRVTFNDQVEYSVDPTNKKKVKGKLDKFEIESDKLLKKKKKKAQVENIEPIGFVNEALDIEILSEELNDNAVNEYRSKKMKKKKGRRLSNLETIEEAPEEDQELSKVDRSVVEVVTLDNDDATTGREDLKERREKKRKAKENKSAEPIAVIDIAEDEEEVLKHKKKKKKKHSKKDEEEVTKDVLKDSDEILNLQKKARYEQGMDDMPKKKKKLKHLTENTDLNQEDAPRNEEKSKKKNSKDKINEAEVFQLQNNDTSTNNFRKDTEDVESEVPREHSEHSKVEEELTTDTTYNRISETWTDSRVESNLTVNKFSPGAMNGNSRNVYYSPQQRNNRRSNTYAGNNSGNGRVRMTKYVLKRLFHNRAISDFPGSNIFELKGYGIDAEGTIQS